MPPDDVAYVFPLPPPLVLADLSHSTRSWPPGKNSVKREGALRLWGFLTFFDHMAAFVLSSVSSFHLNRLTVLVSGSSARFKAYVSYSLSPSFPSSRC